MKLRVKVSMCGVIPLLLSTSLFAQVMVATASNVQYAMDELVRMYADTAGPEIQPVYGSSGKLCTQIKNGAPFDIFVSADKRYPDSLRAWNLVTESPRVYAYGTLVFWTMQSLDTVQDISIIKKPSIKRIAIADPQRAPYGFAAMQALERSGLIKTVEKKIIYGENVSQVAQYVTSKAADAGFNAKSIVVSPSMKDKGTWIEVDSALYEPIAQAAVLLRHSAENKSNAAKKFYEYLFSEQAKSIFIRFGYKVDDHT